MDRARLPWAHRYCVLLGFLPLSGPALAAAAPQTVTTSAAQSKATDTPAPVPVTGTVADPSGALIPTAILHFKAIRTSADADAGPTRDVQTDSAGRFSTQLVPGNYTLTVEAEGFSALSRSVLVGKRNASLDLHLASVTDTQQIEVGSENAASTANADNKSALVFSGDQLDTLASSDSMLQQQVLGMAGGSGEGGGQIFVNGFSGGRFPPKDTIREIRINQNPFSTQFDDLGYGRVEIFTKPGSQKVHGNVFAAGTTRAFNSLNPYTGQQPPYFLLFDRGDVSGPLGKNTSFFLSGENSNLHNNAVINAFNEDGTPLSTAVPAPQTEFTLSGRIDRQLGKNNTLIGRYEFSKSDATNNGVGLLVLPSEGTSNGTTVHTLQLGDTTLLGPNVIAETRFQYLRTRLSSTPNSTAPTLIVQGSFNGGGAPTQASTDSQDQFEFQEYLSVARGNHFLRLGARYVLLKENNTSTANYNGTFVFPSLAAYQAGKPNLFSLTAGQPSAQLLTGTLGTYAEDEWKIRKDLTATFGFRLESQSAVPEHLNPAPRAGLSWAVGQTDKHAPLVVLRGAAGVFYQRFAPGNLLTSTRQNGISQQAFLITNPAFYPTIPSPGELTGTPPTPYTVSPGLRIAAENIASASAERSFGKFGQVTVTYYAVRGTHQYNSANINAPLANGTRPLGGNGDVYQFQSGGIEKAQSLSVNGNFQLGQRLSLFGFYTARRQNNDTFGATSFPTQPGNLSADYGPTGLGYEPVGQRLFFGGSAHGPFGFALNSFLVVFSRSRFNIVTGADRNADTQFNDRPAFATNPGPTSVLYRTAYGTFDGNPQPGEAIIPYNYAVGPRSVFLNTELSREWKFGPREKVPEPPPGFKPKPGQKPPEGEHRYNWSFSLEAENALNTNNAGTPVGVLTSPYFGRPLSTNTLFGPFSSSNRAVLLDTGFRF